MIILHFALKNEWDENEQIYSNKEGFIKCYKVSDAENLKLSFSTLKDYVILCIDESKSTSEIKYENDSNSGLETANIYPAIMIPPLLIGFMCNHEFYFFKLTFIF